jgi:hypothetical protein
MSRHSQVIQARKALQNAPRPIAQPQQQQQMGIEALIPLLIQNGQKPGIRLQTNDWEKAIRFLSTCGPVAIPVDVTFKEAREIAKGLTDALAKYDPAPDPNRCESTIPPIAIGEYVDVDAANDDTAAELLAEATANLKGDCDDDEDNDLGYIVVEEEADGFGDDVFEAMEQLEPSRIIQLP